LDFFKLDDKNKLRSLRFDIDDGAAEPFALSEVSNVDCIVYYGRSGSYLLNTLLENHPNILAMNSELRGFWTIPWHHFPKNFEEQILFIVDTWFAFVNRPTAGGNYAKFSKNKKSHIPRTVFVNFPKSENVAINDEHKNYQYLRKPDLSKFISAIYRISEIRYGKKTRRLKLSRMELFEILHFAWALSLEKPCLDKFPRWHILHNLHVPDKTAIRAIEMHFETSCIHMVREPIQSLESHLTHYRTERSEEDFVANSINCFRHIMSDDIFLSERFRDLEFAVRFEDLHEFPVQTLKSLLARLQLPFDSCVLKETWNGGSYVFNSGENRKTGHTGFRGKVSRKTISNFFSESDTKKLEYLLISTRLKWGYANSVDTSTFPRNNEQLRSSEFGELDFSKSFEFSDQQAQYLKKLIGQRMIRSTEIVPVLKLRPTDSEDNTDFGQVIWITGLSGSGKSTTAKQLALLLESHQQPVVLLDGDELRTVFEPFMGKETSYERAARMAFATVYSNLCSLLARQGLIVIIATISLFDEIHTLNRLTMPNYFEIYLDVPLDVLKQRDIKGVYGSSRENESSSVVGSDLQFDPPKNPDLKIDYSPALTPVSIATKIYELTRESLIK